MSTIHVGIPVLKGRSLFTVDKGRAWSAIEHALLEALARKKTSSIELSQQSNLPRRVVIEILTRLMRAGWVELSQSDGSLLFGATHRGVIVASSSELPAVLERISKPISYVIDLVAGDVFKKKDWVIHTENALQDMYGSRCIRIDPPASEATLDANEIVSALLDDDETFVNAERSGTTRRFGLVIVRNGAIEGLPPGRELPELRKVIREAASTYSPATNSKISQTYKPAASISSPAPAAHLKFKFSAEDLILDGPAHRDHLVSVLNESRQIVVIHSTFIRVESFFAIFPEIKSAVERGTRVHILWGQNEDLDGLVSTQNALAEIRKRAEVRLLGDGLIIHPFSTGSHSKFIIADAGARGGYIAVVGSCNWLTSGFSSYEASVRLKDPEMVGAVLRVLSSLVPVRGGDWTRFSTELVHLRRKVESSPHRAGANAVGSIVLGANHGQFVLRARDQAKASILIASNRFGPVASPSVLVPLSTVARERGISADVYYARTQSPMDRASETKIAEIAHQAGVAVRSVKKPRVHAKFLAWDSDDVLISSLNWLSADPTTYDSAKELGVWIHSPGVAELLTRHFSKAMSLNTN